MKTNTILLIFLLGATTLINAQKEYEFRREINFNNDTWQEIIIPDEMYGRLNDQLSDLRIYGFNGDTIEAPYLIDRKEDKFENVSILFRLRNKSHNSSGYYYTFDVGESKVINNIKLEFSKLNFDWRVDVEGSMNLNEWFVIDQDVRIVSIKNNYTDFKFTDLKFSDSQYRYFRVLVKSGRDPGFLSAKISQDKKISSEERLLNSRFSYSSSKQKKSTTILIKMKQAVPVSSLYLSFADSLDFYRQVYIEYFADSIKAGKNYIEYFKPLLNGYVSSISKNKFAFNDVITDQLKVIISNNDNQPLSLHKAELKGKVYNIKTRKTAEADYYLYYGYKYAPKPDYDISKFEENIPEKITAASLGDEEITSVISEGSNVTKLWLWVVIVIVIVTLGSFTLRMIRKENEQG